MMNQHIVSERDSYIDGLRTLGLLLIVLAHIHAPALLFRFRAFDVPLMVFVSGLCVKFRGGVLTYVIKRFKRLYFPVAQFLTLFFGVALVSLFITGTYRFTGEQVAGSYLLLNEPSIGYVWIMRVFLLMALVAPWLDRVCRKWGHGKSIVLLLSLWAITEGCVDYLLPAISNDVAREIVTLFLPYTTGYATLLVLGFIVKEHTFAANKWLFLLLVGLFVGAWAHEDWTFIPANSKYPPHGVYLTYGLLCSFILWYLKPLLHRLSTHRAVAFISRNSMWLYLWHIVPVYFVDRTHITLLTDYWVVRYLFVLAVTCTLLWVSKGIQARWARR